MFDSRRSKEIRPAETEPTRPDLADPADLPLELVEREIESLAADVNAAQARWLELVADFDRREGWANTGCRTSAEWISWRCAISPRTARDHVRVARGLAALPGIRAAFANGSLSYSKARALIRIADAKSEEDLLELARHATAAQLERIACATRRVSAEEAEETHRNTYLRHHYDEVDGSLRIEAKLAPEEGALVLAALEAARERIADEAREEAAARGSAEPRHAERAPRPNDADALVAVAEASLAGGPKELSGGDRHTLLVHLDSEALRSTGDEGSAAIDNGRAIASESARRLACDASLITLLEHEGRPVSVGRKTRTIPPAIRRALASRDGTCRFPGCERHRHTDAHHIRHWAHGGETSLDNLILLCRHHHRLVHEGGFSVTLSTAGEPRFHRPDGRPIPAILEPPRSHPIRAIKSNRARGYVIDERTCHHGSGEPMDLAACVDAALAAGRGPQGHRLDR